MSDQPNTPKRRWLRFSLRTLFVVLTIGCVWLGWKVNKANQQRKAVAWAREMHALVVYEHDTFDNLFLEDTESPEWQHNLFGVDFLKNVESIRFSYRSVGITDASPLVPLTDLRLLMLSDTQITDVEPLADMTNLESLWIDRTQVSDLSPLAELTELRELEITGCPVSDEEIQRLQKALPNLKIKRFTPRRPLFD